MKRPGIGILIALLFIAVQGISQNPWNLYGGSPFTGANDLDMEVSPTTNEVYVAGRIYNLTYVVYKYASGSGWQQVGSNIGAAGVSTPFSLHIESTGEVYMAYVDNATGAIHVEMFNGAAWSSVGSQPVFDPVGGTIEEVELGSNGSGGLALAFTENTGGTTYVRHYDYNGSFWNNQGLLYSGTNTYKDLDLELNPTSGNLIVSFLEDFGGAIADPLVFKYNGASWIQLASSGTIGNGSDMAMKVDETNGNIYVAYIQMNAPKYAYVYMYDGVTWYSVGSLGGQVSTQNVLNLDVMVVNSNPVVAFVDMDDSQTYVYEFVTAWSLISPASTSGGIENTVDLHGSLVVAHDQYGAYYVTSNNVTSAPAVTSVYRMCTQPVISATAVDASCNGLNDGQINISGAGGVSPYQYSINGGITLSGVSNYSGLAPGSYVAYIEDANGCSATQTVAISEPTILSAVVSSQTNVVCNGGCDGSATISASGGTSPYSYAWDASTGNQTTSTATGLCAGSYSCTVTDANGCSTVQTVSITQSAALSVSIASFTNVTCNGYCDGVGVTSVSGGVAPYIYIWSNGSGLQNETGLCAGTHTVQVQDNNGCSASTGLTITEPPLLSTSFNQTNVSCNGSCDGSVVITSSGGTSPYSYSWDSGIGAVQNPTNLCVGTYTCTITDANGCVATQTVTISEPSVLSTGVSTQSDVLCNGNCDGSATVFGSGGTTPYAYAWDVTAGNQTTSTATGLCVGSYTCTVTDGNGCSTNQSVIIIEPLILSVSITSVNVACSGICDGSAIATASGGTAPYMYSWDSGIGSVQNPTGLCAGTYICTVTDGNGCVATSSVTITEPSALSATGSGTDASCNGVCDGTATATVTGGTTPYTYSWDAAAGSQTTATATGLCAGSYACTITDANGCSTVATVAINEPAVLTIDSETFTDVTTCGGADGTITITVSGGSGSYSFSIDGGSTFTAGSSPYTFTGLVPNTYQMIVDDGACQTSGSTLTISEPNTGFGLDETNVAVTNASCANNDGSITGILTVGGNAPYTYAYNGTSGGSIDLTGAQPGTYTLTVTDGNNCSVSSSSYTIGATSSGIVVTLTPVGAVCNGQCNGSITSNVSGGTAPYTYVWSNGNINANPTGICAGNYTVYVSDANGCEGTAVTTVSQPAAMTNTVSTSLPTCGSNNGSAIVTGTTGGTAPYSYQWSNGDFGTTADSLVSGVYTVTVTDANGCKSIKTVNLSSATAPAIANNLISPACHGGSDGSIDLTITGGTAPITFDWSTGEHTEDISNLSAGIYDVTISDATGCTISETFTLADASAIDMSNFTVTNASCGGNDGEVSVTVSGGAGGYTYLWSSGGTSSIETGLVPGTYTLSVSDANGCLALNSYTVSNAAGPVITVDQVNEPTCQGATGDILVSVSGGIPPYSYQWSNGANNEDLFNVSIGNYELIVTDNAGCQGVEYAELLGVNFSPAEICMVTVDTATGSDVVVWNKEYGLGISKYEIFRETSVINEFQKMATIPFDSLSQYVDTSANSSIHSYQYKLRTVDSCGNNSEFLTTHKTIHLASNIGLNNVINLSWDDYIGFAYTTFYINRYHSTTGWATIDSVAANVHSYTDNNYPGLNTLEYNIEVRPSTPCVAEKAQDHNSTRSNRANISGGSSVPDAITEYNENFRLIPNPTNGKFSILFDGKSKEYVVSIMDLQGKLVQQFNVLGSENRKEWDISHYEKGVYLIHVQTENSVSTIKLVKQ